MEANKVTTKGKDTEINVNAKGARARLEKATERSRAAVDRTEKTTERLKEVKVKRKTKDMPAIKRKLIIVASVLAAILVLAFVLFGGNSAQGTWELYSIEQGGNIIEGKDLEAQYGGKVLYNLNSDSTLVVVQLGQEIEGTWSEEEDVVFFHYSSSVKELQRDGNTMVLEQNGGIYTFIR